jgi:hypothetical protein
MPVVRHVNEDHIVPELKLVERFHRLMMAAETKAMHSEGRLAARSSMGNGLLWARHVSCQENSCQLSRFLIWGRGGGAKGPSAESEFR